MKILAAGDIHGDKSLAERLAEKADKEKVKLVILCGDLTSKEEPDKTSGIIGPFLKKNQKVLIIPGNHDSFATTDFLAEFYGIKNIHGYSVKYEDIGLFGCGFANIGVNQLSEAEIFSTLKNANSKIKTMKKRIMVTHVHPSKTKMEKLSNFVKGSSGVTKAINQLKPDIVLCSHIHEAEGLEEKVGNTRVINVGRAGKILDI
ncbi:metallophosphoesterase family protein [Candidatus Woesearchaeota archaeon]|nr:metallophosphoesterase family protein [Candidatus Woesearchaeota archaeon]